MKKLQIQKLCCSQTLWKTYTYLLSFLFCSFFVCISKTYTTCPLTTSSPLYYSFNIHR